MSNVIQSIYMTESNRLLFLLGFIPDAGNPDKGWLILVDSREPKLERKERYYIDKEDKLVKTSNYYIPIPYIIQFLIDNDSVIEKDGKACVDFTKVIVNTSKYYEG